MGVGVRYATCILSYNNNIIVVCSTEYGDYIIYGNSFFKQYHNLNNIYIKKLTVGSYKLQFDLVNSYW